jgi:hypothetical protein
LAAPDSEPPPDDPFFDAVLPLDEPLFARVLALDPFLLRDAVDRAPAPLRELLDLERAAVDLPPELLEPFRDFELLDDVFRLVPEDALRDDEPV